MKIEGITGHYVVVDGTRLYYDECGEGVPLVVFHTAGTCSLLIFKFLPVMAKHGFRVIAPDLPGHGKSFPVNWTPFRSMHEYSEFMFKFVKEVTAGEKPIVSGTSIGGNMTLDIACNHSAEIRAAICCQGAARTPMWPSLFESEDPHAHPGWRNTIERAGAAGAYRPCPEERIRELRWLHRFCSQEVAVADLECWVIHDVRDQLKNITCPTMVYKGEWDFYAPDHFLHETMAGMPEGIAELVIGKKTGHFPMFEEPELVADVWIEFLKRRKVV